jgi:hypothetical protein
VSAGDKSNPPLLRLLAAGMVAVVALAASVAAVMLWLGRQPEPVRIADAQAGEATQYAEAAAPKQSAPAPKQAQPAPKQPPQAQAPKPAQIDRNGVLILIRETLLALDQANKTGNYTVLRDLGSPQFQANTAARLAEIFAQQRRDKLDLSGVAVIDPQLTLLPQIEPSGLMRMAGFFPSVPTQVNFELAFAPVDGRWKLFGLSVSFGQAAPAAPQPPAAPQAGAPPAPAKPPERPAAPKQ